MYLWQILCARRISGLGRRIAFSAVAIGLASLCGCGGGGNAKVLYALGLGSPNVSIIRVTSSGVLSGAPISVSTGGSGPNVMAIDPAGRFAYILDSGCAALDRSICASQSSGGVSQYVREKSGNLTVATFSATTGTPVQSTPVPTGLNPSAMAIDSTGTFVLVANRGSNPPTPQNPPSLSAFTIDSIGGTLTEVKQLPPPTCTPNQFSICPLNIPVPPTALATTGKMLFVAMAGSGAGSIATYTFDSTGTLASPAAFTTPAGVNPTAMMLDPTGKFLIVADSTANTVAVFGVASSGQLTAVGTPFDIGANTTPVSVRVSSSGKFVFTANQGSNNVSTFSMDSSGALTKLSDTPVAPGTAPSYVTTDASGTLLYVANRDSNSISVFTVDSSGALKPVTGSPFPSVVSFPAALAAVN